MFLQMPAARGCRAKTSFLLPLAGALILAFSGTGAGYTHSTGQPATGDRGNLFLLPLQDNPQDSVYDVGEYNNPKRWPRDYRAFLKRNPQVEKLVWHWRQSLMVLRPARVIVTLKSGDQEIYKYNDASEMARARKKYGRLPWAAPPVARFDLLLLPEGPQKKEAPIRQE